MSAELRSDYRLALSDERSWGFTVAEVVRDKEGDVKGLNLSYGERTRQVFFAAVED